MKIAKLHVRTFEPSVRTDELPAGVCAIVTGIAVVYDVWDSWGTRFKAGSLEKTRAKVGARKVKFFANHGAGDSYGIRTHVGTVVSLVRAGNAEVFTAELFDTDEGRHAKAYLEAVMKSRAETGASIGFYERAGDVVRDADGKYEGFEFTEVELDEISLAPRQAVPGAVMTHVRRAPDALLAELLRPLCSRMTDDEVLALIRTARADGPADVTGDEPGDRSAAPATEAATSAESDAETTPALATDDDRINAIRRSFAVT